MTRSILSTLSSLVLLIGGLSAAGPAEAGSGGTVVFLDANFSVNETEGSALITVQRVAGDDGAIAVSYRSIAGSATAGADYTETAGMLQWPSGDDDDRTFSVPVLDDDLQERGETLTLELISPTGGASIGAPSTATLTIVDDEVTGPGPPEGCTPDATTLCLQQDRFRVTSQWRRTTGETGDGMAIPLTADTGYFWFFNQTNVEMIVKVLRGCANNGSYWVFAGGLTNVEVDLTVRDTTTDDEKVYRNILLNPFQPIQDVTAFENCP